MFPFLSGDYLRSITFGVYQLSQAPNYADQHLKDLNIKVNKTSNEYMRENPIQTYIVQDIFPLVKN